MGTESKLNFDSATVVPKRNKHLGECPTGVDNSFNEKTKSVEAKIKEILIFPRYHQLELNRKFKKSIIKNGVGTNYLVQHTPLKPKKK